MYDKTHLMAYYSEETIKGVYAMTIDIGTKYQISKEIKSIYNSADTLTVTRLNGGTVQFTLGDGKGHGSMPLQHLEYLLKRNDLTEVTNKRMLLKSEQSEKDIV